MELSIIASREYKENELLTMELGAPVLNVTPSLWQIVAAQKEVGGGDNIGLFHIVITEDQKTELLTDANVHIVDMAKVSAGDVSDITTFLENKNLSKAEFSSIADNFIIRDDDLAVTLDLVVNGLSG